MSGASPARGDSTTVPLGIGIIGGEGRFGRWCARLFETRGFPVAISDRGTQLSNCDLTSRSDVVILAVPMSETERVVHEITSALTPETLLVELTSVKAPFQGLFAQCACEVLSLHPLFAPSMTSYRGERCTVWRTRSGARAAIVEGILRDEGVSLVEMAPDRHDRIMAVVQGVTHFQAIAAAHCIQGCAAALGFSLEESLAVASPVYRLRLGMIGRILGHDPALYAEIQTLNPYVPQVLDLLEGSTQHLKGCVVRGDVQALVAEIRAAASGFGPFVAEAMEESTVVIEALREFLVRDRDTEEG